MSSSEIYKLAREKLALNVVPGHLPCREKEITAIKSSVGKALYSKKGLTMYIAGETGTGKTATIREVLRDLCEEDKKKTGKASASFKILFVNAMKLKNTKEIYIKIYRTLHPKKTAPTTKKRTRTAAASVTATTASPALTKIFSTANAARPYLIVVIDELDFLVTRDQKEVYDIFNWPQLKESKLCVIGIANTINLPEQIAPKIANRIEMTERITFETYKHHQISIILEERLKSLKIFEESAIAFCASKVSKTFGDIRRAFDLCRKALEKAEEKYLASQADTKLNEDDKDDEVLGQALIKINIELINQAYKELFNDVDAYPLKELPLHYKVFLFCALEEIKSEKKRSEVKLENVLSRMQVQCKKHKIHIYTMFELMQIVDVLQTMRLVHLIRVVNERFPLMKLDTESEFLTDALRLDQDMAQFFE